ncbi:MAG: hypothetical protein HGB21_01205 [Nitrospirae bacterium]|nr:hypothetical protein [Nitrospirota bacterium]NTW64919.1 hypothetical protein [Nitrospirota bacterium]
MKENASLPPSAVVRNYCNLDAEGARLGGSTASDSKQRSIWELVTWEDEPGWDSVVAITGFRLLDAREEKDSAVVRVQYDVLGDIAGSRITVADRNNPSDPILKSWQTTDFHLKRTPKGWRIASPVMKPHPVAPVIISHLEGLLASESGPGERYDDLVKTLRVLKTRSTVTMSTQTMK